MFLRQQQSAQSLLEAIIAIGVILVAAISSSTLIVTTITSGQVSADKIQAANLAREGVEIVRSIRDSNWLKRAQNIVDGSGPGATTYSWDDTPFSNGYTPLGSATGNCYFAIYDTSLGWYLVADSANPPCTPFPSAAKINKVTDSGMTYFTSQYCPGGVGQSCSATKYSRMISIQLVTSDATAGDYLDVRSTVTWNNHGAKSLDVSERLYDWR